MKDEGVSSVVAAVLVFALFSTAFLLWTLNTQPEWVADRENNHMSGVKQDFATIHASLEQLSTSQTSGPASGNIKLAASPLPLLQGSANSGQLEIKAGSAFDATFTSPRLHAVDGQPVGTADATVSGAQLLDVATLRIMHIAMDAPVKATPSSPDSHVQLLATAGTQTVTLTFTHVTSAQSCGGPGVEANLVSTLTTQPRHVTIACTGTVLTDFHVDPLDDSIGFQAALARLGEAFQLDMTTQGGGSSSTFMAVWIDQNGHVRVEGSGDDATGFGIDLDTSALMFKANTRHFPDQTLLWDLGAVAVMQGADGAIKRDPSFLLDDTGSVGYMRWTVVDLSGDGGTGGSGTATVVITHDSTETLLLTASAADFTVASPAGAAWRAFFEDADQLLGDPATVTPGGSGNTATLSLSGHQWIIELRIIHATAAIV